jgi:hypothetical protein
MKEDPQAMLKIDLSQIDHHIDQAAEDPFQEHHH